MSSLCTVYTFVLSGKPRPRVTWFRNDRPLNTATWFSKDKDTGFDVTNNNVTIEALTRADVHTQLTCETSNFDSTVLRTSVEIDMKCECQFISHFKTFF